MGVRARSLAATALLAAAAACAGLEPAPPGIAPSGPEEEPIVPTSGGRVTRVVDGDTFHALVGGRDLTIRLIGVDTPETVHPRVGVQCFGAKASRFAKRTLDRERVRLSYDVERVDRYGRTLAYVHLAEGDVFFNLELVRRGYATVLTIPPNVAHADDFVAAQREARAAGRGLWGACR